VDWSHRRRTEYKVGCESWSSAEDLPMLDWYRIEVAGHGVRELELDSWESEDTSIYLGWDQ
jgi:hypothetical protein